MKVNSTPLLTFVIFLIFALYLIANPNSETKAQSCGSGSTKATDLVSAPNITGSFATGPSGACVVDPKAAFLPFKIPTYDDLKSVYYNNQKQIAGVFKHEVTAQQPYRTQADIPFNDAGDAVYHVNGNLNISGNNSGTHTGIVFVEGNLDISGNYCYGAANCLSATPPAANIGTVFIVQGNVNIDPSVTRIDAIIIASGTIYTAGASCAKSSVITNPLTIYGSLISVVQSTHPHFCRTLAINNQPAEKINHQVKYLVILRQILSDTFQRWSEIP